MEFQEEKKMTRKKLEEKYEETFLDFNLLEFYGDDLGDLQERIHSLASRTSAVFYLTVPIELDPLPILVYLGEYFQDVSPLNVGTNPRLTDNDVHTRRGFVCLK